MKSTPHFVLFSRTGEQSDHDSQGGSWYFRLESAAGDGNLEVSDIEPRARHERLELLAVVRGLEALEQPSSVTLVTSSRQVSRAVRQGLEYWRVRDWKWERFGEKVPMKNGDLWKRIDRAMQIHDIHCRTIRVDQPHAGHSPKGPTELARRRGSVKRKQRRPMLPFRPAIAAARWTARSMHSVADALQSVLPDNSPNPRPIM